MRAELMPPVMGMPHGSQKLGGHKPCHASQELCPHRSLESVPWLRTGSGTRCPDSSVAKREADTAGMWPPLMGDTPPPPHSMPSSEDFPPPAVTRHRALGEMNPPPRASHQAGRSQAGLEWETIPGAKVTGGGRGALLGAPALLQAPHACVVKSRPASRAQDTLLTF